MADVVRRTRLDARYGTELFTGRRSDVRRLTARLDDLLAIADDAPAHRPGRGVRSRHCGEAPPARLRQGIEEFNRGEFFRQHETLEHAWLEETDPIRYLYQGILQVGVGFEHLRRGNAHGARSLWARGIGYLEPFRGGCMGVDVDRLIADTERCLAELERAGVERFDRALIARVAWL
jgi:predicted metal-dependent hydrolase